MAHRILSPLFHTFRGTRAGLREWKHPGFSVDNSVLIEAGDQGGMQRLVEYIARCPFSLTRMISLTDEGNIIYRASNPQCVDFPVMGDNDLISGNPRNFEVFKPLDFLANVTQHIPDKGEHQVRYYRFYSNKKRGIRGKEALPKYETQPGVPQEGTFAKKCKMTWAALIKCVYEVDPLKCPKYGGTMKVISFIERHQPDVIEKVFTSVQKGKVFKPFGFNLLCLLPFLRHCGLWKEEQPRPPPHEVVSKSNEPKLDYGFFEQTCL